MSTGSVFTRDGNHVPITTLGLTERKAITFDAGTTGATGATTLFTITGTVAVNFFGFCTADLTGTGTIEVGVAGATAALCAQQSATAIDNHEVWQDAVIAIAGAVGGHWHPVNQDIIQTIASNTVTGGTLVYYVNWVPLSSDGNLTIA